MPQWLLGLKLPYQTIGLICGLLNGGLHIVLTSSRQIQEVVIFHIEGVCIFEFE